MKCSPLGKSAVHVTTMQLHNYAITQLIRDMRFPTMWYVRPAKAQTSLRICAV